MLDTHVRGLLDQLEETVGRGGAPVEQLARIIETVVEYNAGSPHEQVILLNDLASLAAAEQAQIVQHQRQIVDLVGHVLARVESGGKITRATRKVHTMMLFGIINYTYTWYDPTANVKPKQLARMATDLFLNGIQSPASGVQEPAPIKVLTPLRRRVDRG